jgi:hypothetical protein
LNAQKIIETWTVNPAFSFGETSLEGFSELSRKAAIASETIEAKRIEFQGLINDRDYTVKELQGLISRARSGFREMYGPDSSQYEQVGGIRSSERKVRSTAKKTTPKTVN